MRTGIGIIIKSVLQLFHKNRKRNSIKPILQSYNLIKCIIAVPWAVKTNVVNVPIGGSVTVAG